jgi:hypothetical protein
MIDIRQGIKSLAKIHAPRRESWDLLRKLAGTRRQSGWRVRQLIAKQ